MDLSPSHHLPVPTVGGKGEAYCDCPKKKFSSERRGICEAGGSQGMVGGEKLEDSQRNAEAYEILHPENSAQTFLILMWPCMELPPLPRLFPWFTCMHAVAPCSQRCPSSLAARICQVIPHFQQRLPRSGKFKPRHLGDEQTAPRQQIAPVLQQKEETQEGRGPFRPVQIGGRSGGWLFFRVQWFHATRISWTVTTQLLSGASDCWRRLSNVF